MAAAFDRAGFDAVRRAHDRPARRPASTWREFRGLVACGGFSYGDVLGAGEGWAKSILFHARAARRVRSVLRARRHVRARRLQRLPDVRGAARASSRAPQHWPRFVRNRSEQFEARFSLVEVLRSPSVLLAGHGGLAPADRGGARRRARGVRVRARRPRRARRAGWSASATSITTAASPTTLSRQPERLALRHRGADATPTAA